MSHRVENSRHPAELRRQLFSLLEAMESLPEEDLETRQLFLEMAQSTAHLLNTDLGRVIDATVHAARGQDLEGCVRRYRLGPACVGSLDTTCDYEVDLFVLTIKQVECWAVLDALTGRASGTPRICTTETFGRNEFNFWLVPFEGKLVGVGQAKGDGNAEAAVAMAYYARSVRFTRACLIGMAGGHRLKTKQGDVIAPAVVWDYDRRKLKRSSESTVGSTAEADRRFIRIHDSAAAFNGNEEGVRMAKGFVCDTIPTDIPPASDGAKYIPDDMKAVLAQWKGSLLTKNLLSGGALVEDPDAFEAFRNLNDSDALALDMESFGFAVWCDSAHLEERLILRGVSDYCDVSADGTRTKEYQYLATYYAAALLRAHFLSAFFGL